MTSSFSDKYREEILCPYIANCTTWFVCIGVLTPIEAGGRKKAVGNPFWPGSSKKRLPMGKACALPRTLWFSKTQQHCHNMRHMRGYLCVHGSSCTLLAVHALRAARLDCGTGTWEMTLLQWLVWHLPCPHNRAVPAPLHSQAHKSSYCNSGSTVKSRLTPVNSASLPCTSLNMLCASKVNN